MDESNEHYNEHMQQPSQTLDVIDKMTIVQVVRRYWVRNNMTKSDLNVLSDEIDSLFELGVRP